MAYKALYRTYRPQTFEEVAGQQHIVRTLKNALETNKIAHAYLFCGPRGTGKTTMAKLFAKALNCEEGVGHQCNKCSNCVEVTEGSHPDVIEIDAASNNGVEQVRDLIDKVNYLPIKGRYKVYIIDEVHMMTMNAFNALLKTLEEPPAHVIFILATTEPHNILPTILSRCQRYDFTKVSDADIEERMIKILEKENVQYDKDAVRAIISLADGGMRDALSILDQILAYSGNTLSEDDVFTLFGLASTREKIEFIKDIANGDVSRTLERISAFSEGGVDLKRLTSDILDILKDVLILRKTRDEHELSVLSENEAEELVQLFDARKLNEFIRSFINAQIDYKTVNNIKTLFELVVLRLCTLEEPEEAPVQKVQPQPAPVQVKKPEPKVEEPKVEEPQIEIKEEPVPPMEEIKPEPMPEPALAPAQAQPKIEKAPDWLLADDDEQPEIESDGDQYEFDDDMIIKLMVLGDKEARKALLAKWGDLNAYISHPTYGSVVSLLKDGRPFIVTKQFVVLEYDFEKLTAKANIKSNQKLLSELINKMVGHEVFVYSISRSESVRLITAYHNLRQISQLPKPSDIKINIEEIK